MENKKSRADIILDQLFGADRKYLIKKDKGGTRKIADLPKIHICNSPEHGPAMHIVYKPGIYEHICPECRNRMRFTVQDNGSMKNMGIYTE